MHSFTDKSGGIWVACSECERGGNGSDKEKCASGWKVKRFNGLGCFIGILMAKYKKTKTLPWPLARWQVR
jgi:hypothetical protein